MSTTNDNTLVAVADTNLTADVVSEPADTTTSTANEQAEYFEAIYGTDYSELNNSTAEYLAAQNYDSTDNVFGSLPFTAANYAISSKLFSSMATSWSAYYVVDFVGQWFGRLFEA